MAVRKKRRSFKRQWKYQKKRFQWSPLLAALILLASGALALYRPSTALSLSHLSFIPIVTLCVTGLLLLFKDRQMFTSRAPAIEQASSVFTWLLRIVLAWSLLWCVWVAHVLAWVIDSPQGIQAQLPHITQLLAQHWQAPWYGAGYPWSVYTLVMVSYLWFARVLGKPVPEACVEPLFSGRLAVMAKNMVGIAVVVCSQLMLALTCVTLFLLVLQVIEPLLGRPSHMALGLWVTVLMSTVFLALPLIPWARASKRLGRYRYGYGFWTLFIMIGLMLSVLACTALVARFLPPARNFFPIEEVFTWKMNPWATPELRLETMMWGWWLLWSPLMGSYLAYISQGQRWWLILTVAIVAPMLMWMSPLPVLAVGFVSLWQNMSVIGTIVLSIIVFLGLRFVLRGEMNTRRFVQGWMDVPKGQINKVQGLSKMLQMWATVLCSLVFLHALGGWYIIHLQIVMPALFLGVCVGLLNVSLLLSVYQYFKNRPASGGLAVR